MIVEIDKARRVMFLYLFLSFIFLFFISFEVVCYLKGVYSQFVIKNKAMSPLNISLVFIKMMWPCRNTMMWLKIKSPKVGFFVLFFSPYFFLGFG